MATSRARTLRANMPDVERRLWSRLRDRQLDGFRFRRQVPLGQYVVDFCCLSARLVVEVDGGQHELRERADEVRSAWLEAEGFRVIRFWNNEVLENLDGVLQSILLALEEAPPPRPSPARGEGEGRRLSRRGEVSGAGSAHAPGSRSAPAPRTSPSLRKEAAADRSELPLPAGGEGRGEGAAAGGGSAGIDAETSRRPSSLSTGNPSAERIA